MLFISKLNPSYEHININGALLGDEQGDRLICVHKICRSGSPGRG